MAISGLKLIVPTSVSGSGVSVSSTGLVTFTAAADVTVDGCFSATYDAYMVVTRNTFSVQQDPLFRLRASGTTEAGTDYANQRILANAGTVSASRQTSMGQMNTAFTGATIGSGEAHYFFGPFLAQPTIARCVSVGSSTDVLFEDQVNRHGLSTSYDGFLMFPSGAGVTMTGSLAVYGFVK